MTQPTHQLSSAVRFHLLAATQTYTYASSHATCPAWHASLDDAGVCVATIVAPDMRTTVQRPLNGGCVISTSITLGAKVAHGDRTRRCVEHGIVQLEHRGSWRVDQVQSDTAWWQRGAGRCRAL